MYLLSKIVTESQKKVNKLFYNAAQVRKKYGKEEVSLCFTYIS